MSLGKQRQRSAGGAGARLLFLLLVGLGFLLVFALAEGAGQREMLLEAPTAVPAVPAAALSDRQDWLENGALRFADGAHAAPQGWQVLEMTDGVGRVYRAAGESFLRLDCAGATCITALWQRVPVLAAGDYLCEADVYLETGSDGAVSARLGYDDSGGVDPLAETVVWSERARARGWQRLRLEVQEAGGPGTIFLILDALSSEADCRVAGVRLLGPPGLGPVALTPTPSPPPAATETDVEVRAAYLRLAGLNLQDERELTALLDMLVTAHVNGVFVQARYNGLAYYDSPLEPAAPEIAGAEAGVRWDPLARAVALGHERGLQVHAWLEMLPVWPAGEEAPEPPGSHLLLAGAGRLGEGWRQGEPYQGRILASPASEPVRAYLASLGADVVKRYAVDGLYLDGLVVSGADPMAADARLTALLTEVAAQARTERPGLPISALAEPVPAAGEGQAPGGYGLSPTGAWWSTRAVDAILVAAGPGEEGLVGWLGRGGPVALPVLDVVRGFADLADAIHAARKAGAAGMVLDDAARLQAVGHAERLASGPFTRRAVLPPSAR